MTRREQAPPSTASVLAASAPSAGGPEGSCLAVEGLRVARGDRLVLEEVSFRVARAEVFGILGPNGAGKTTAFHALVGLIAPEEGRLLVEGRPFRFGDRALRERVGVVFQSPALDPRLTARENLRLAASLHGVPRGEARRRIEQLLGQADLEGRADEPVERLSGGMRRRVELARAMVHEPPILILDEPTTGLDEGAFRKTWNQLLRLRDERGLTLLLTTHRPEEAERCDRLAILDRGRIVASDTPERLRALVRGDLLVIEAAEPASIARELTRRFGVEARVLDGKVLLEKERGHEMVPRLVEAFPEGTLRSVSIRRPGLGEVFLEITGRELAERDTPEARGAPA